MLGGRKGTRNLDLNKKTLLLVCMDFLNVRDVHLVSLFDLVVNEMALSHSGKLGNEVDVPTLSLMYIEELCIRLLCTERTDP